jgi:hypothetical protein
MVRSDPVVAPAAERQDHCEDSNYRENGTGGEDTSLAPSNAPFAFAMERLRKRLGKP